VASGHPFVFTSGNHDSDELERQLAEAGAIVLDREGQLRADGTRGPVVVRVAGLRVAGYGDPNERRAADGYRDRGASVTPEQQEEFADWLTPLVGNVDVVLVHEPALASVAVERLRAAPPEQPLLLAVGHTHKQAVDASDGVVEVDGGTIGAGGTGNLGEGSDIGLAVVSLTREPFAPLAADLVVVDPGTGAARGQRVRLDAGIAHVGEPLS
jgi:hypothetical protein